MIGRVHRRVRYFARSHWEGGLAWGSVRSEKGRTMIKMLTMIKEPTMIKMLTMTRPL